MKKVWLFAALLFSGGVLHSEPWENGPRRPSEIKVWKSTNVAAAGTAVKVSNSAFLHSVSVSSPAAVDSSEAAVLTIYGSQDGTGDILARIQTSTTQLTSNEIQRWPLDIYASTGFSVTFTTGDAAGDQAGAVQVVYQNGPPQNFKVWSSTFFATDTSTHSVYVGKAILKKVAVLKAATGTSALRLHNSTHTAITLADKVAEIDVTGGDREFDMNLVFTRGIMASVNAAGTATGDVMLFFKKAPPLDWEYWTPNYSSGTVTTKAIFAGRGVFGGVLNGDGVADSQLTVYDSNGTANNTVAIISGDTAFDFDESNYEIHVTSGLTVSSVGAGQYTIRYRKLR